MKIRKATKKDIEQIRKIADVEELRVTGGDRAPSERWFNAFIKEKQMFLVAEEDKKIVGFILGERVTGDLGYLWEIGVEKKLRSKGIGKLLLNEFIKESKKRKLRSIITYGCYNKKTLNFFKKNNFFHGEKCEELKLRLIK
ncbi:GNAT family N-acetyltransferase [archaeon]|nr:GNAT family N-acetyltransferase [archaeon]